MKIYKITEASEYLGVSINTLKTLANNGKVKSFKTTGGHRRFRQEDLDAYMGACNDEPDCTCWHCNKVRKRARIDLLAAIMEMANDVAHAKKDPLGSLLIGIRTMAKIELDEK